MSVRTQAVEAEARHYLSLFPAWLRPTRGEEAVGLVLDLLPPDAQHLPWRSKLDLVRAGLHARRIGTPPVWVWSRVIHAKRGSAPVPAAWLPWLSNLVQRRAFALRMGLAYAASTAGPMLPLWGILWGLWMGTAVVVVAIVIQVLHARGDRRIVCAVNGLAEDGGLPPPGEWVPQWWTGPVGNLPILRPLLLAAGAALVAGLPMTLVWPQNPLDATILRVVAVVAAIVSGWLGFAWWRALRRGWAGAPGWPLAERRRLGSVPAVVVARLADGIWLGVGAAIAWGSAWVAVGIGAPAAALAPGALLVMGGVILARAQRRAGRPLGLWDAVPQWAPHLVMVERGQEPDPEPMPGGPTLA